MIEWLIRIMLTEVELMVNTYYIYRSRMNERLIRIISTEVE